MNAQITSLFPKPLQLQSSTLVKDNKSSNVKSRFGLSMSQIHYKSPSKVMIQEKKNEKETKKFLPKKIVPSQDNSMLEARNPCVSG